MLVPLSTLKEREKLIFRSKERGYLKISSGFTLFSHLCILDSMNLGLGYHFKYESYTNLFIFNTLIQIFVIEDTTVKKRSDIFSLEEGEWAKLRKIISISILLKQVIN